MQYTVFADVYDTLMNDVDYDAWADYISKILRAAGVRSVVECACGTGSVTVRLAREGFNIIGVDISREMLTVATNKARKFGKPINFICMDMSKLVIHRPVDAVISTCDGVNYLTESEALRGFFEAAYNSLKPNGIISFDISSYYKLKTVIGNNTFASDEGDVAYIWENEFDAEKSISCMELSLFINESDDRFIRRIENHTQRAYTVDEIKAALTEVGFTEVRAYDFGTFNPPAVNSHRVQFVGVRR